MDLNEIFHSLNREHFSEELPLPTLLWNSRLRSSAGRFCPGSRNIFKPRAPLIEIATYLQDITDGAIHVKDTLLHEMIHYWLWFKHKPYGHTAEFHRILKRVGARRYNPVPKETKVKYWYECPKCLQRSPARRKLSNVACLSCCKRWNGGHYHESFRLQMATEKLSQDIPLAVLPFSEVVKRLDELRAIISNPLKKF